MSVVCFDTQSFNLSIWRTNPKHSYPIFVRSIIWMGIIMTRKTVVTVFGATGSVGQHLLPLLSNAGIRTIAVSRRPSSVTQIPSVHWFQGDMADKQSLHRAMEGSSAVFLASGIGERFVEEQANVAEVAKSQGVEHVVKLSTNGVVKESPFFVIALNYQAEEAVKASGVTWTMLRPHSFMQNWLRPDFAEVIREERKIYEATGEGKKPFIDTRDIAEVAFRILSSPAEHRGQTYVLTADEAVSYGQVASAIGQAIGEAVQFISLTSAEATERMRRRGVPPFLIQTFIAIAENQRDGKANCPTGAVRTLLGRPSRTVRDFARDHVQWFK